MIKLPSRRGGAGLPSFWLDPAAPAGRLLAPLGGLFAAAAYLRRGAYRHGLRRSRQLPVPVIVVGNIFIGGTGKTPLVAWIVARLQELGRRPGVLLRGYGGSASSWPQQVSADSDPAQVGDEPVLLARRTGAPIAAGPDRIAAGQLLIEAGCDVLVSDDGLQHYRMARDLELVVLDAARGLGNGRCLPAGPLRESPGRLAEADLVLGNGGPVGPWRDCFELLPGDLVALKTGRTEPVANWRGRRVHAVAGIGNPDRFFDSLTRQGLEVTPHPFPDHHAYGPPDLAFEDDRAVIMTEKDAVKVFRFAASHHWYQPVTASPSEKTRRRLMTLLEGLDRP